MCDGKYVGAVVCKMETYNEQSGYIAMLAVDKEYRKRKIGKWDMCHKKYCVVVES